MGSSFLEKIKGLLGAPKSQRNLEDSQLARIFFSGSLEIKRRNLALIEFLETRALVLKEWAFLNEIPFSGMTWGLKERLNKLFKELERLLLLLNDLTENKYLWLFSILRRLEDTYLKGPSKVFASLAQIEGYCLPKMGQILAELGEVKNVLGLPVPDGVVLGLELFPLDHLDALSPEGADQPLERLKKALFGLSEGIFKELAQTLNELFPPGRQLAIMVFSEGDLPLATIHGPLGRDPWSLKKGYATACLKHICQSSLRGESLQVSAFIFDCPSIVASGAFFTRDPRFPAEQDSLATAVWGLSGLVPSQGLADLYLLDERGHLKETIVEVKEKKLVLKPSGLLSYEKVPQGLRHRPCLSATQIKRLHDFGALIENHLGGPREIRWGLDKAGWFYLFGIYKIGLPGRRKPQKGSLISHGRPLKEGIVSGPLVIARGRSVPPGSILLWEKGEKLTKDKGIRGIIIQGEDLAPEGFDGPVIAVPHGDIHLETQEIITLDAFRGQVYQGRLGSRLKTKGSLPPSLIPLFALNLPLIFGPEDPLIGIKPGEIQSLNDILHLAFEAISWELSRIENEGIAASHLLTDPRIPLSFHVLDLGGGLSPLATFRRQIGVSDIKSTPFLALWQGMTHEGVSWRGPVEFDLGGFFSVVSRSFVRGEVTKEGGKALVLLGQDYLFLKCRLAYHLLAIEARSTEFDEENYLVFRFGGGGAGVEGRRQRSLLLEDILKELDFRVEVRGDSVIAFFLGGSPEENSERLDQLGRLMGFTRQLDMTLQDERTRKRYVQAFFKGYYSLLEEPPPEGKD
ncbi:PEP/pyruvate-binding domain-containing protein [Thermosulfuriphilus sp.]